MRKNLCVIILILALLFVVTQGASLFAEEKTASSSVLTLGTKTQNVYGAVGKVEYVDFKTRGESTIVLKTSEGESIKVSLKELKSEATVLATFRKETDKKGKEKNTLVSLSIVKTAKQEKK
ncbi:MAG: hypothetical protein L6416_09785 [Candidatus Omnitrophica bacterium]|nr:hypothetical protein [Candidatus Omnitrophota bacterium]